MDDSHERADWNPVEGGCDCGHVRYRLESPPLIVHCCHCRWCQRESGAAFALNALIESDRVTLLAGEVALTRMPSQSGLGQTIARCPECGVGVWSYYGGAGTLLSFVKVGSLDDPDRLPPDVHIFTESKQPWVVLSDDKPVFREYYRRSQQWPAASIARYDALAPAIAAFRRERDAASTRD
jgi:hypothetical protein